MPRGLLENGMFLIEKTITHISHGTVITFMRITDFTLNS